MDKEKNKVKKSDVILDYDIKIHLYFIFSLYIIIFYCDWKF